MNYSTFNQTYDNRRDYKNKSDRFYDVPDFPMYDEDKYSNSLVDEREKAVIATKGIMCEDNLDPVITLFFSNENINRIQKMIRNEIFKRTKGKYKLDNDQDESDLLIAMRAVLFDANNGARFLPFKIKRQVKKLNYHVVEYVVPDMIAAMKQQYGYLKEINQPLRPMLRPMNVNQKGRKCLPSITTLWGKY